VSSEVLAAIVFGVICAVPQFYFFHKYMSRTLEEDKRELEKEEARLRGP
jgi:hypothetical protein